MSRADHTLADDGMRQFTSRIYTAAKKSVIVYYHKKDGGEHPVIFVRNSLPLPPPENAFLEIKLSLKD